MWAHKVYSANHDHPPQVSGKSPRKWLKQVGYSHRMRPSYANVFAWNDFRSCEQIEMFSASKKKNLPKKKMCSPDSHF